MFQNFKLEKYKYPIILGLKLQIIIYIVSYILLRITPKIGEEILVFMILIQSISVITSLILFKNKVSDDLKWFDFNVVSIVIGTIFSTFSYLVVISPIEVYGSYNNFLLSFIGIMLIIILPSIIVGIFLEKGPTGLKIKRLISVLLFIWTIYKLYTSFSNSKDSKSQSGSVDTDGDGVKDMFDTNGDGIMDSSLIDLDGDGIKDTIAKDFNGDGLIDSVYSDTNHDGKIDSFIKDTDGDGFTDLGAVDTDGNGKPDKLI